MINTNTQSTDLPASIDGTYPPTPDQLRAAGWRDMPPVPPIADGYTRLSIRAVEGDGINGQWEVVDRLTSEIEAESRAARMATFPAEKAALFRAILRKHFGDGAETNRALTAEAVTGYFAVKPNITADEVRDGVLLRELFAVLSEWNGTGETWTLPWEVLP